VRAFSGDQSNHDAKKRFPPVTVGLEGTKGRRKNKRMKKRTHVGRGGGSSKEGGRST